MNQTSHSLLVKKEAAEGKPGTELFLVNFFKFAVWLVNFSELANCEIIYVRTSWEKFLNGLPRSQKNFYEMTKDFFFFLLPKFRKCFSMCWLCRWWTMAMAR